MFADTWESRFFGRDLDTRPVFSFRSITRYLVKGKQICSRSFWCGIALENISLFISFSGLFLVFD